MPRRVICTGLKFFFFFYFRRINKHQRQRAELRVFHPDRFFHRCEIHGAPDISYSRRGGVALRVHREMLCCNKAAFRSYFKSKSQLYITPDYLPAYLWKRISGAQRMKSAPSLKSRCEYSREIIPARQETRRILARLLTGMLKFCPCTCEILGCTAEGRDISFANISLSLETNLHVQLVPATQARIVDLNATPRRAKMKPSCLITIPFVSRDTVGILGIIRADSPPPRKI